jgi:hypothetical protein
MKTLGVSLKGALNCSSHVSGVLTLAGPHDINRMIVFAVHIKVFISWRRPNSDVCSVHCTNHIWKVSDIMKSAKGSVSNITKDVTQCLNSICRQYIKIPTDRTEQSNVMHGFQATIICNETGNAWDLMMGRCKSFWNIWHEFNINGRESLYLLIMSASSV